MVDCKQYGHLSAFIPRDGTECLQLAGNHSTIALVKWNKSNHPLLCRLFEILHQWSLVANIRWRRNVAVGCGCWMLLWVSWSRLTAASMSLTRGWVEQRASCVSCSARSATYTSSTSRPPTFRSTYGWFHTVIKSVLYRCFVNFSIFGVRR